MVTECGAESGQNPLGVWGLWFGVEGWQTSAAVPDEVGGEVEVRQRATDAETAAEIKTKSE